MREIVGVVADTRDLGMEAEPPPQMYVPYAQSPSRDMSLVLRASGGGAAAQVRALRRELAAIDPEQPVSNVRTMEDLLSGAVARPRFNSLLLSCFAGIALALAVVGIYGVMSYSVTQRTREFGIRMALGAQVADVRRMVLRRGASLCAAGLALGLAGSLALTRPLSSLLFGVTPTDPISFLGASILLAGVALLACYLPARRATRVDPMNALRCD